MFREIKNVIFSYESCVCRDKDTLEHLLKEFQPDVVLSDYSIGSSFNGLEVIKIVKNIDRFIPVIIISGSIGEEIAVDCLKSGAGDYILKDRLKKLPYSILELIEKEKIRKEKDLLFERLKESNERYSSMFENSKIPMLLLDPDNDLKILEANDAAVRLYGYTKDEFKNLSVFDLNTLPKDEVTRLANKARNESQFFFDFQHCIKNGEHIFVNVYSGPVKFGEKVCLLSFIVNITEKKLLERKNKKLEEHINHLNRVESLGRLAATIAHDFNNILTPIISYSDMGVESTEEGSVANEYFRQIRNAADKAASLTRQILAVGRKQILAFKKVDIKNFFSEIHNMLHRLVREDIEFKINISDKSLIANIDTGQISQVLINMIVNAVDAVKNSEVKKIIIDVDNCSISKRMVEEKFIDLQPGEYILIEISDTGCGIPKEDLKKIFEPFYTTKLDSGGSGLGLAISFGIIKQHKGDLAVYSEVGKGTTFKIYIPAEQGKIDLEENEKKYDDIGKLDLDVMLVEDNKFVSDSISKGLQRFGCRVVTFNDPVEAINAVINEGYRCDLLVSDIIMPKYNGKEIYILLKEMIDDLKVIFISGYSEDVIKDTLDKSDACFIQKPFDSYILAAKIKEIMNKK